MTAPGGPRQGDRGVVGKPAAPHRVLLYPPPARLRGNILIEDSPHGEATRLADFG